VDDDLHFVEEAIGEQRADRAVDQAAGQRFQLARAAFALEEAAGDLAGGVGLLDVVDGQREEVLAGLGLGLGHHGGQHHGVVDAAARRRWTGGRSSPVSSVTVCWPHWKVLVTLLNMLM
jgi:hypothetical protein